MQKKYHLSLANHYCVVSKNAYNFKMSPQAGYCCFETDTTMKDNTAIVKVHLFNRKVVPDVLAFAPRLTLTTLYFVSFGFF